MKYLLLIISIIVSLNVFGQELILKKNFTLSLNKLNLPIMFWKKIPSY